MKRKLFLLLLPALAALGPGCSHDPYKGTNKFYKKETKRLAKTLRQVPLKDSLPETGRWVGTTNFNLRKPSFVIIHHTAQNSCEQTLKTFTRQQTQVSAHYLVCRDGTIHHLLNDYLRAWHAGIARWGNLTDINSASIGIELDNNGTEPFSLPQISSLLHLLGTLKKAYNLPAANFIGHSDIAPSRKVDPSRFFPWKQLADSGFGIWYSDTTLVKVPAGFNQVDALHIIGYDTRDSLAAIRAFRLHFLQDSGRTIDPRARKILYSLYQKCRY